MDCDDTDPALNLDDADSDGASTCDGDCDDGEADVSPGGSEVCDGLPDLLVGAPGCGAGGIDSGSTYLVEGGGL